MEGVTGPACRPADTIVSAGAGGGRGQCGPVGDSGRAISGKAEMGSQFSWKLEGGVIIG